MQHAGPSKGDGGGVVAQLEPPPAGFHPHQADVFVFHKARKNAYGVGAPAHTGYYAIRQPAGCGQHLFAGLAPDDRLEAAHYHWVGMGPHCGAQNIEGAAFVLNPVLNGGVDCFLQGALPGGNAYHPGSHHFHAEHVQRLTAGVFLTHVHHALHAQQRGNGGGGHPMLAGPGFGDNARFAHAFCQQGLPEGVVHLVGAQMVQVLALEVNLRSSNLIGQVPAVKHGSFAAGIVLQQVVEFGYEHGVLAELVERLCQIVQNGQGRVRHILAPERSKVAFRVWQAGVVRVEGEQIFLFAGGGI